MFSDLLCLSYDLARAKKKLSSRPYLLNDGERFILKDIA